MPLISDYLKEKPYQEKKPQKQKGRGGFLSSLISEAGGTGGALTGAAIGSALLPGVGTVLGGLAGGFLGGTGGRLAENKVRDNEYRMGDALQEGAISGIAGAGPIKLVKGAAGALKGAAKGTGAAAGATEAIAKPLLSKAGKTPVSQAIDAEASGIQRGGSLRGETITPDKEQQLLDFMRVGSQKYGGVKAGTARKQSDGAQAVFNNVTKELDANLDRINRAVGKGDIASVLAPIKQRVLEDAGINGTTKTTDKFIAKIEKAKDLKELEAIRKEADNLGYTNDKAGKASGALQARHVRDAIDDFITAEDAGYKAVKGDYRLAKDALELTSKAAKSNAGAGKLGGVSGVVMRGSGAQGAKSRLANAVSGQAADETPTAAGYARRIFAGRALDNVMLSTQSPDQATAQDTAMDEAGQPLDFAGDIVENSTTPGGEGQYNPYAAENVQHSIEQIMAQGGDQKDIATFLSNAQTLGELTGGAGEKPLSAEAAKVVSNADSGLQAINDFRRLKNDNPSSFQKSGLPGVGFLDSLTQGRVSGAMGTSEINAAADNIVDIIARLRTGAAISQIEEKRFKRYIPLPGDSPAAQEQKLNYLERQLDMVARRSGSASSDLEAAALQQ